ncbi:tyrosine-protein phosphatase [Agromyces sp. NPDC127015]|uniref:tyrosine-protein phosphatase n=1 Tax=Agromyces sp. NPDC127015 TaxID=3347108 RepID=UPI003660F8FD
MSIDGLVNFRDTGGMPLQGGGTTRSGVLFRSAALSALSAQGLDELAATQVGVIVDFRTPAERESAPDLVPDSRPFSVVDLSILEGAVADSMQQLMKGGAPSAAETTAAIPSLGDLYIGMLQHGGAAFARVARLIAASNDAAPTGVLVHCTAGKDRTGVATALMLDAVGVERDAVVADYAASQANLSGAWADGMLHMVASFGIPLTPELETLVTGTPPEAIEATLGWIDREHGGAAGYLGAAGLADDELGALRARLTAEVAEAA